MTKNTGRWKRRNIYYDRKVTDGRKSEKPKEKREKMTTTFRLEKIVKKKLKSNFSNCSTAFYCISTFLPDFNINNKLWTFLGLSFNSGSLISRNYYHLWQTTETVAGHSSQLSLPNNTSGSTTGEDVSCGGTVTIRYQVPITWGQDQIIFVGCLYLSGSSSQC